MSQSSILNDYSSAVEDYANMAKMLQLPFIILLLLSYYGMTVAPPPPQTPSAIPDKLSNELPLRPIDGEGNISLVG